MKLSAAIPAASLQQAKKQLKTLRCLTIKSDKISQGIRQLILKLRKVPAPSQEPFIFTSVLAENEKLLHRVFSDCGDIEFRVFYINKRKALLIYLEGMTNTTSLEKYNRKTNDAGKSVR